jgi:hypothetical protein
MKLVVVVAVELWESRRVGLVGGGISKGCGKVPGLGGWSFPQAGRTTARASQELWEGTGGWVERSFPQLTRSYRKDEGVWEGPVGRVERSFPCPRERVLEPSGMVAPVQAHPGPARPAVNTPAEWPED